MKVSIIFPGMACWYRVLMTLTATLLLLMVPSSCEKEEYEQDLPDMEGTAILKCDENPSADIYFGPVIYYTGFDHTAVYTPDISNPDFDNYENFVLRVKSGWWHRAKMSYLKITVDGAVVVEIKDTRKNVHNIKVPVTLTPESVMEITLCGNKWSFVLLWIEATQKEEDTTTVTDADGNVYPVIMIGTQTWLTENLKTTKLNDGTDIPNVTDNTGWAGLTTQGYCWYGNDIVNKDIYGALYNNFTVQTGKLCPTGWHLPTHDEWIILQTYLGGMNVAGGKLKETGIEHWLSPNTGATNETGFTALPGGFRSNADGTFFWVGRRGEWWEADSTGYYYLKYDNTVLQHAYAEEERGMSVRCIKDN